MDERQDERMDESQDERQESGRGSSRGSSQESSQDPVRDDNPAGSFPPQWETKSWRPRGWRQRAGRVARENGTDLSQRERPDWERDMASRERGMDPMWRDKFLQAFAEHGDACEARKVAGVDWLTLQQALAKDTIFAQNYTEAGQEAFSRVWQTLWKAGIEGEQKPVWYQGEVVGYETVRDHKITMELARAYDPERFDSKVRAARVMSEALAFTPQQRSERLEQARSKVLDFVPSRREQLTEGNAEEAIDVDPAD